jgi:mono/diheme cytochrome c family protein
MSRQSSLPLRISFSATLLLLLLAYTPSYAADVGQSLYKSECAGCHSADGSASSPASKAMKLRDLRSPEVQKQTDAELTAVIAKGSKNMPPYQKRLGDAKIRALVSYMRQIAKSK